LDAATVTIGNARVLVNAKVITKSPKSARGYRTLPVDAVTVATLRALRDLQSIEAIDAVPAYAGSGYVAADELGQPMNPEHSQMSFSGCPPTLAYRVSACMTCGIRLAR
jgi:hypothetical protein